MDTAFQLLMGVSIASCAGLRAFLPLLAVGLLGRLHVYELNPAYAFLSRTDALTVLGTAALLELMADKVIAVDHLLDAVGTLLRPVAGFLISASLLTHVSPLTATALALVAGGATSLTVHAGKAALRYKTTAFAPLHAGLGNLAISLIEDGFSIVWLFVAAFAPVLGFVIAAGLLVFCGWLLSRMVHSSRRLWALLRGAR